MRLDGIDTAAWSHLTPAERIAYCHRKAAETQHEARSTDSEERERLLRLAKAWLELALDVAEGKDQPKRVG